MIILEFILEFIGIEEKIESNITESLQNYIDNTKINIIEVGYFEDGEKNLVIKGIIKKDNKKLCKCELEIFKNDIKEILNSYGLKKISDYMLLYKKTIY